MEDSDEPDPGLDLGEVEQKLRAEERDLEARLAVMSKPPERGSQVGFGKRVGDGTTEAVSRLTDVGVFEQLTESKRRIHRALEKIADGTYGKCDVCGEPIPLGRLQAAPHSTTCVEHAR